MQRCEKCENAQMGMTAGRVTLWEERERVRGREHGREEILHLRTSNEMHQTLLMRGGEELCHQ